jgi:hypothetical protein
MRKVLVLLLALAPLVSSAATVLWFSVDPNATITTEDGEVVGTVSTYVTEAQERIQAARVVDSGDGALNLYYQDEMGAWTLAGEIKEVMLDDGPIQWQPVAVPDGTGEVTLQLGYFDSGGDFIALAFTTASVPSLTSAGHTSSGSPSSFQDQTPWTPNMFHTTPEPTTVALLLVGAAAMLLKRKC